MNALPCFNAQLADINAVAIDQSCGDSGFINVVIIWLRRVRCCSLNKIMNTGVFALTQHTKWASICFNPNITRCDCLTSRRGIFRRSRNSIDEQMLMVRITSDSNFMSPGNIPKKTVLISVRGDVDVGLYSIVQMQTNSTRSFSYRATGNPSS